MRKEETASWAEIVEEKELLFLVFELEIFSTRIDDKNRPCQVCDDHALRLLQGILYILQVASCLGMRFHICAARNRCWNLQGNRRLSSNGVVNTVDTITEIPHNLLWSP